METVKMRVTNPTAISIGRVTENLVKLVEIDISEWRTAFPYLENYSVIVKNPDGASYPAVTETDGDKLLWTITASDTGKAGRGFFQISAQGENGEKKLSAPQSFTVNAVLPAFTQEEPPEALKGYVDKILSAAERAENAAETTIYQPIIGENGNWFLYNFETQRYEDSGKPSQGSGTGGSGENGATFIPSVSESGVLSWTNDKNLPNPQPVDIRGPAGPQGEQGPEGPEGAAGSNGVGVTNAFISVDGELIFSTSDGKELNAGAIPTATMPDPQWNALDFNSSAVTYPEDTGCVYAKIAHVVSLQGAVKLVSSLAQNASVVIGTMPEGFRPKRLIADARMLGGSVFQLQIATNGEIKITNYNSAALSNSYNLYINIEYIAGN